MEMWLGKRAAYLRRIIMAEGTDGSKCSRCHSEGARWRCRSCLGRPMFCRACCRTNHRLLIYHRIEKWNGRFFQDASLWEVGVRLHLGHQGLECPSQSDLLDACKANEENRDRTDRMSAAQYNFGPVPSEQGLPQRPPPPPTIIPDPEQTVEGDDQDDLNWEDVPSSSFTWVPLQTITPTLDDHDNPFMLIVDSTGLLSLPVVFCSCPNSDAADELLLNLELLPASYESVKTAFTFRCLDDYRSSNLECKTSAYQYYQKLRRLTNPAFPQAVPNRYNEFRRVTRQWRNLKLRKWFGFGHRSEAPSKGSLALFCPACPQPDVNLPADFKTRYTEYVAHRLLIRVFSMNFPQNGDNAELSGRWELYSRSHQTTATAG
jgi:hypothetical protein